MAFNDAVNNQAATENVQAAPAAPTTQGNIAASAPNSQKTAALKAQGASIREQASKDEKDAEGQRTGEIEFVSCLGDPAAKRKIMGPVDEATGKATTLPTHLVVGYQFKALADIDVPVKPLKGKNLYEVEAQGTKHVSAGEVFSLNIMETAELISRVEYAGWFTGGDKKVFLSVVFGKSDDKPHPVLKMADGNGSIKSNMTMIANMVGDKPELKEEFKPTFEKYYIPKGRVSKPGAKTRVAGEDAKNLAAAFRTMFFN